MKVDIYKNLNKDCYSIRSREKDKYGKVIDHSKTIILKNVIFIVGKKGRERVLQEKRKNVHAYARGTFVSKNEIPMSEEGIEKEFVQIKYDPYEHDYFYRKDTLEPISEVRLLYCTKTGIWAKI